MKLLLDTQILVWMSERPHFLPAEARELLESPAHELVFSAVSVWEVAIKNRKMPNYFVRGAAAFRDALSDHGVSELVVSGVHAAEVEHLPLVHGDPFDRLLIAQARVEQLTLLTTDTTLARYVAPIMLV